MLVNTIVLTALLPCLTKILFSENFYNFAFRKIYWIFAAKDAARLAPCKDDKVKRLKFNKRKAHGVRLPHA